MKRIFVSYVHLKYEVNGLTRTFLNKSKQICQTRKNQEFHKTIFNLKIGKI